MKMTKCDGGMCLMDETEWLVERFEAHRTHLRAVAYRLLGSWSEADDAVQEAWLRLSRADTQAVANLGGWLTTVVARVCLDLLRARQARREEPFGARLPDGPDSRADASTPEHEALLTDAVGLALLVVLDTLTPAERLAFVLHDVFGLPFAEIAPIVARTPSATRQLASRARRRVRGATPASPPDHTRRRALVAAFLAASRAGDFAALVAVLDPGVVLRADRPVVAVGAAAEVQGAAAVAETFAGRARDAQPALVNGSAGAVWAPGGRPRVVFSFTFTEDRIAGIELIADPAHLARLHLTLLYE